MSVKQIHKKTLVILIVDLVLFLVSFAYMQGGFPPKFWPIADGGAMDLKVRGAAEKKSELPNATVIDFSFDSNSTDVYRLGREIKISCRIEQEKIEKPYELVLKTDKEDMVRKTIEPKNDEMPLLIESIYRPNETGLRPVACRADFGNVLEESDERDNRMVKYLMVF